jgi:hypothetical protein
VQQQVQRQAGAPAAAAAAAKPVVRPPTPLPIGNQARLRGMAPPPRPPSGLRVGTVNDPLEREADAVADRVMRMADPEVAVAHALPAVRRKCAECEEEQKGKVAQPKAAGPSSVASEAAAPPVVHEALSSPARPLDPGSRALAEPHIGRDLGDVRVHTDATADRAAHAIGARAFTVGRDIAFAAGEYAPATPTGQRLLLHELAHVAQQTEGQPSVQRKCTHDGTAVNCHNWSLPLPPWAAGTAAHLQIAGWAKIPPHGIPRATKVFKGLPSLPYMPRGYADLWQNGSSVNIGEIKSTATGSSVATDEANHYVTRHDESMARGPAAADDKSYLSDVGGTKPGGLLDLSGLTGAGIAVGPFIGDPGKTLNAEADNMGAVVYWCTGTGIFNPLWLVAFKAAMDALKKTLAQLKKMMEEAIDAVVGAGQALAKWVTDLIGKVVDFGAQHKILAFAALMLILLVAIVVLILSILAEPASGGTSTATAWASLMALVGAAAGILTLVGLGSPTLPDAAKTAAAAILPAEADKAVAGTDYDPKDDQMPPPTSQAGLPTMPANPGDPLIAALKPLGDPQAVATAAISTFSAGADQKAALTALQSGAQAVRAAGDATSAADIEKRMKDAGLA